MKVRQVTLMSVGLLMLAGAAFVAMGCSAKDAVAGKVQSSEITYKGGGVEMKGYLAVPAGNQRRPAVLVVHEWWGHNAYARRRADMLAAEGYVALAVDMYGDGKTAGHPKDAGKFAGAVMKDFASAKQRFVAAMDVLKKQPGVDPDRIAAIGYCFGGGIVLNMARQGVDLKAVASFHGSLNAVEKAKPGAVRAKLLVMNGAADTFVSPEAIAAFRAEMKAAGANLRFINYPGAKHGFTNPEATAKGKQFNIPLAYDKQADEQSWQELLKFLKGVF